MTQHRASPDLSRHAAWGLLAGLIVVGTGLRFINLDSGLWYDEIRTLLHSVRTPLGQIVTTFPGNNDHLLYSVLSRISIVAFGEHAWSLRLPAVIFGIASIAMLYILGAGLAGRFEAVLAALLLTVSYHAVWFSQNARAYTALLFFVLLTTHLLLAALKSDRRALYVAYGAAAALGAYAHLTMVLVVLTHAGIVAVRLLAAAGGRLRLRDWINPATGFALGGLLTLLLYAPVLLEVEAFFTKAPAAARVATAGWAFWAALKGLQVGFAMSWALLAGAALFLIGCWSYLRQSPTACALLILPGPVTLAVAILLERPTFPRFFFFLAGFGLLIAVRGAACVGAWLARLRPGSPVIGRLGTVVPLLFAAGLTVQSTLSLPYGYRYPKQDFAQAASFVESQAAAGDRVAVIGGGAGLPYLRYYNKPWPRIEDVAQLDAARAQPGSLWLLFTFQSYIERRQPALFGAITKDCVLEKSFHGTVAGGSVKVYKCADS